MALRSRPNRLEVKHLVKTIIAAKGLNEYRRLVSLQPTTNCPETPSPFLHFMTEHMMTIDAHHHLWDLEAVHYPWLSAQGEPRFFGDPSPIQRNYLIDEFREDAGNNGFKGSVHIQVGAADPWGEATWVDGIARTHPDWPLVQVAFCDLTSDQREHELDRLQTLGSIRGVRQIVGRAPGEDAASGTNTLIESDAFAQGLKSLQDRGLSFDLQLLPELMAPTAMVLRDTPDLRVALCHAGSPYDRSADGIRSWSEQLIELSALPNIYCKLSGLGMFDHQWETESFLPIVETCLEQFGADRCMFGSNFPVDSLTSTYSRLIEAYRTLIPLSDHSSCFGQTAFHFYRF